MSMGLFRQLKMQSNSVSGDLACINKNLNVFLCKYKITSKELYVKVA